jgi:hypothetical protein
MYFKKKNGLFGANFFYIFTAYYFLQFQLIFTVPKSIISYMIRSEKILSIRTFCVIK